MLLQDRVITQRRQRKRTKSKSERLLQEQIDTHRYFSDEFQSSFVRENSRCYYRSDMNDNEIRQLRQGDYVPECFLDLHGLTQYQAKWQLAAFIVACCHRRVGCVCIIHGHGKNILKQCIPFWLVQSPWIRAFHEAPQRSGGSAALVSLIDLDAYHYRYR